MRRLKEHKYFNLGAMILSVVALSLVMLAIVLNIRSVTRFFGHIISVLTPIFVGVVLAYLMNPLMNFMERRLYPWLLKKKMKETKAKRLSRVVSLVFALLVLLVFVYEFFALLLPQLYESILGIVNNFSSYVTTVEKWITSFLADNPEMQENASELVSEGFEFVRNWATNGLLPGIETILSGVTTSVFSFVEALFNVIVGLFVAVYILYSRDTFTAQSKKLLVAVTKEKVADRILNIARRAHKVFYGYIMGVILDSLIVGILCYIGMRILSLPYPELISTVVGITNVIPFFGPFIGAVPCGLLILLVNPMQAVHFAIFILIMQQIDGNVICPRIQGNTIGISGFWIITAITLAGGLFGFAGMVLGVPVFAVCYTLVGDFVSYRLKNKNKPTDTDVYRSIRTVQDLPDPEVKE